MLVLVDITHKHKACTKRHNFCPSILFNCTLLNTDGREKYSKKIKEDKSQLCLLVHVLCLCIISTSTSLCLGV